VPSWGLITTTIRENADTEDVSTKICPPDLEVFPGYVQHKGSTKMKEIALRRPF
jgi:hypothetical protein